MKLKNIPIDIYLFDNLGFSPNRIIRSNGKLDLLGNDTYAFELFIMSAVIDNLSEGSKSRM